MESKILKYLSLHPKHPSSPRELSRRLDILSDDRPTLRRRLKELAKEGKILPVRGGRYASLQQEKTVTGTLKVHEKGYGFVIPESSGVPDHFIPAKYMNFALNSDRVLAASVEGREEGKKEGRILQILERGKSDWIGVLSKKGRGYFVESQELPTGTDILVPPDKLKGARLGQTVVVRITHYPAPHQAMRGFIFEILGESGSEEAMVASILVNHEIPRHFPKEVNDEVVRIASEISENEYAIRTDLRQKPFLTIDGIRARDFDDAVFVERHSGFFHLFVSIADVAHYVLAGHPIDCEAQSRGTSVYFPDLCIPMLPEKLSNDLCSLKPGLDRLTLTCEMKFSNDGEMLEASYYESVIQSQKRGIYTEVQNFFDGGPYSEETDSPVLRKSLLEMKVLAELLLVQRKKRGSIDFDLPEAEIVYNHEGKITAVIEEKRFFSHRLIEEFMIAANVAVATLFAQNHLPALYRVHEFPDPNKLSDFCQFIFHQGIKMQKERLHRPRDFARLLEQIQSHPMEALIHQVLLRSMKLAVYEAINRGHFGLALDHYTHFTSPIRRYPDLIIHRQLKSVLHRHPGRRMHLVFGKKGGAAPVEAKKIRGMYHEGDMAYFGVQSTKREKEATEAEREMTDFKRALFMREHLREKFFGTIRRVTKFGLFIELSPHYVDVLLHVKELTDDYYVFDEKRMRLIGRKQKKKIFRVGDKIWVMVKDVSLENRTISLSLVS